MSPSDVAMFTRYARTLLVELGYDAPNVTVGRGRLALSMLGIAARRYRKSARRA
jgi:hypothetical protein